MDPRDKELLQRVAKLAEENHAMLKKMRRDALVGKVVKGFYWIVILGAGVTIYYYVQELWDNVSPTLNESYADVKDAVEIIKKPASFFGN
jgi:hypothetical protein